MGPAVGSTVGLIVGPLDLDGLDVGAMVGSDVGSSVGLLVGSMVGYKV